MNANTIVCPNCKTEIPLTDAMAHRVREQLEKEFAGRLQKMQETIATRENEVVAKTKAIEAAQKSIEQQVAEKLTAERKVLQTEAQQQAKAGVAVELQDLRQQVEERKKQLAEAQKAELELRKKQGELQQRAEQMELEVARKIAAERETIRQQATAAATEAERFKLSEKEKLIADMQQQIATLKQKAEQGSMQLQGEVLELDLENQLATTFPHDAVEPVSKGVKGGDIHQQVRTNAGHDCGLILWEAKRTKNWTAAWTTKVKEDQRAAKSELAVIVTQVLPTEVKHFGLVDGVWVCDFQSALPLAAALRHGLLQLAVARLAETGKAGKMEELYSYLCGLEFRQHVEALVETFTGLQDELAKERRAMEKIWAGREKQIVRAISHTAQLYGSIQSIAGAAALPEIETLALDAGELIDAKPEPGQKMSR